VDLPAHPDQAEFIERREDGGARADHDIERARAYVEPGAVSLPCPSPREEDCPLPECLQDRSCCLRERVGLGHEDQGPAAPQQACPGCLDSGGRLLTGQRSHPRGRGGPTVRQAGESVGCRHVFVRLLPRHARGVRSIDGGRERDDVALADPAKELEHAIVEETDAGTDLSDRQEPALGDLPRRPEDPARHRPTVERNRDEASGAGVGSLGQQVGERTIQLQARDSDADVNRARQPVGLLPVKRKPGGGRRRGRSPPRRNPCARSGRRPRSVGRSAA
jgi:hypothetical protein